MPFTLLAWQHLPIYKKQAIHKHMSRFFLLHFLKVLDKLNIIIDYPVKEIKMPLYCAGINAAWINNLIFY